MVQIVDVGIPVMGHLGLTPQSIHKFGTYQVRATTSEEADEVRRDARALQDAGVFALVLEKVPAALATEVSRALSIPVIGIGAGPATDGQVLVLHDLLGVYAGHQPKFVKRFANLREESLKGVRTYSEEVRARRFPDENEHTYSIPQEELEEFARYLEEEALVGTDTPWDW